MDFPGVAPDYAGHGLANVAPTLLAHFGCGAPLPPLATDALPPRLIGEAKRIVILVVDGLGAHALERHVSTHRDGAFARLAARGSLARLTSVLPSTTSAALATLGTGLPPARHGIVGYRMFLPRLGAQVNMIYMMPAFSNRTLPQLGLPVDELFPFKSVVEWIASTGVEVGAMTRDAFIGSPISQMIYRGREPEGFVDKSDLFVRARKWIRRTEGKRGLLQLYWDHVDTVGHAYGPDSEEYAAEIASLDDALGRELVDAVAAPDTLLLVTADHGHVTVPREHVVSLNERHGLLDDLAAAPSGEGRFTYLHARAGAGARLFDECERAFAEEAWVLRPSDLIESDAFGPGPRHPELERRLGDVILAAKADYRFEYAPTPATGPTPLVGHHGGVSEAEMRVPLLAARLG